MGFRQFLLRGLDNVEGEWSLSPWRGTSSECLRSATVDLAAQPRKPNPQIPESDRLLGHSLEAVLFAVLHLNIMIRALKR
jgi:hypothetical protein